jgi:hypothetical protein
MIEELRDISNLRRTNLESHRHRPENTFTRAGCDTDISSGCVQLTPGEKAKKRTYTINPEKRTSTGGLPFLEETSLNKPRRGSHVMDIACITMVRGWIGWREPFEKAFSQFVPFKDA